MEEMCNSSDFVELENRMRCAICNNEYEKPKILNCKHSFCEKCLKHFIQDNFVFENNRSGFPCPTCSEFVLIQADDIPTERWCELLDDDNVAMGMLSIIRSSDFSKTIVTSSDFDGTVFSQNITEKIPGVILPDGWYESAEQKPDCKEHGKSLEYFCNKHAQILCNDCVIMKHRLCDGIVKCDSIVALYLAKAGNIMKSAERNGKIAALLDNELAEGLKDLMNGRDKVKHEVRNMKEEMIRKLNEAESEIYAEIDETCYGRSKLYTERINCCKTIIENASQSRGVLSALSRVKCPEFIVHTAMEREKSCEAELTLLEEIMNTTHECRLHLVKSAYLGSSLESSQNFGHVTVSESVMKTPDETRSLLTLRRGISSEIEHSQKLKLHREQDTLQPDDKYNAWITGVTFLCDDRLVVVDRKNEKLKLFSKEGNILDSSRLFPGTATLFGIATTDNDEVAVTLPVKHIVQFVTTVENKLIPTRSVDTKQPCFGIASGLKQLFVCCSQLRSAPCCVKVFDNSGSFIRDIIFDNEGAPLFTTLNSASIALNPISNLLSVVDQPVYRHSLVTIDFNGSVKSRDYTPYLRDNVNGIAYMNSSLLVAIGNRTLCTLSENDASDNEFKEIDVSTRVYCPQALAVNGTKNKIAVSQADPRFSYKVNNIVMILSSDE